MCLFVCLYSEERFAIKMNLLSSNRSPQPVAMSVCNPLLSNYKFCESNPRPVSDIPKSLEDSREEYK